MAQAQPNPFDRFDPPKAPAQANPFDQFDALPQGAPPAALPVAQPPVPTSQVSPSLAPMRRAPINPAFPLPGPKPVDISAALPLAGPKPPVTGYENLSMLEAAQKAYKDEPRNAPSNGNFFTDLPAEYQKKVDESVGAMKGGASQAYNSPMFSSDQAAGALTAGLGGLGYLFSPISAAVTAATGNPVERLTGIPSKYTDTAVMTALPGVGVTPTPKMFKNVLPPKTNYLKNIEENPALGANYGESREVLQAIAAEAEARAKTGKTSFFTRDWGSLTPLDSLENAPSWSDNVSAAIQDLSKKLQLGGKIAVVFGDPIKGRERLGGQVFAVKNGEIVEFGSDTQSSIAIVLNKNLGERALPVAIHELGHAVDQLSLIRAGKTTQDAIETAYTRSMGKTDPAKMTPEQLRPITLATETGQNAPLNRYGREYKDYALSYDEWIAEQISRWITTDAKPIGVVERFFKGAADRWKLLYEKVVGYQPLEEEVASFMRGQWKDDIELPNRGTSQAAMDPQTGVVTTATSSGGQGGSVPPGGAASGTPLWQAPAAGNMPVASRYGSPVEALAKTLEKIFSPSTVDRKSREAANLFRQNLGEAARQDSIHSETLRGVRQVMDEANQGSRNAFINYIENRSRGATNPFPGAQPLADAWSSIASQIETQLAAIKRVGNMNFRDNYFPHLWEDPQAAQQWLSMARQGRTGFTKKRTLELYADGLAAGLKPKYANPVDAMEAYITNANRFLAHERIFEAGKRRGYIKYLTPKMAAKVAAQRGLVPLDGRLSKTMGGPVSYTAYAPENFARVYNNMISKGWEGATGDMVRGLRQTSSGITAAELGFSGFHAFTTAYESATGMLSNALTALSRGRPVSAAAMTLKTPLAPVLDSILGVKLANAYKRPGAGSALDQRIAGLVTDAGARPIKQDELYFTSERRGYLRGGNAAAIAMAKGQIGTAFKQTARALKNTVADLGEDLSRGFKGPGAYGMRNPSSAGVQALSNVFTVAGNTLDTVMGPLFKTVVPTLKNGAAYRMVREFLDANPNATREEQLEYTRRAIDSIDNRYGEMVTDNVAYTRAVKEGSQILLRSGSYVYGQLARELGGAFADFVSMPFRKGGKATPLWTEKMSYLVAMPVMHGTMASVATYLMTGKWPSELMDFYKPETGGKNDRGDPERVNMPGMIKELIEPFEKGMVDHFKNKRSTLVSTTMELATNRDWKDQTIAYTDAQRKMHPRGKEFDPAAMAIMKHILNKIVPITFRNLAEGQPPGSKITPLMTALGFQRSSASVSNPERAAAYEKSRLIKEMNSKLRDKDRKATYK